jgi:hypothetical protein
VSNSEIKTLEGEIAQRQARLDVLKPPVTREQVMGMTPRELAAYDPAVIRAALVEEVTPA